MPQSAVREGGEVLRQRFGEGVTGGAQQAVELGVFHRLSDDDALEGLPCHSILGFTKKDRKALGRVGGGA